MVNLDMKYEASVSTHYEDRKGENQNMGWFGVARDQ